MQTNGMDNEPSPTKLAAGLGISVSYASQLLNGTRQASSGIALAAFRTFGLRLGLLADMTDADIEKLCAGRAGSTCEAEAA